MSEERYAVLMPRYPQRSLRLPLSSSRASDRALRWLVVGGATLAVALFVSAYFLPWWQFKLYAPQYPRGMSLTLSLTGVTGDVREINMLNHYIGMGRLDHAARLEQQLAPYALGGLCAAILALVLFAGRKLANLMVLAGASLPVLFLADSYYWLYRFGHDLDPAAPLHVPPFTPEMFGNGTIGQFMTFATPQIGFWLAVAGVACLALTAVVRGRVCRDCARAGSCRGICPSAFVGGKPKSSLPPGPVGVGLLLLGGAMLAAGTARAAGSESSAGPRAVRIPPGAVVARSDDQLRSLIASPGVDEIWLEGRVYSGPIRVTRAVSLRGATGATIDGRGNGTVVSLEAPGAILDNVTVRGSGQSHTAEDAGVKATAAGVRVQNVRVERSLFGIALERCPGCVVERCFVQGGGDSMTGDGIKVWESSDAVIRDSVVDRVRDVVVWYSRRVLLENNRVTGSRYGTHFMYAHDSVVRGSRIERNVVGIFVMYSARLKVEHNVLAGAAGPAGVGIGFKESDGVQVSNNWLIANTLGTYLDRTPLSPRAPVEFRGNVLALNQIALRLHGADRGVRFDGNDFHQNIGVAEVEGGGDALGVSFRGNHWSDYAGYDLDRDGVGDVAYQVKQLSSDLKEAHPALKLFEGTAAMALIDLVARAVPVLTSRLMLVDEAPAARPLRRPG